MPKPRGWVSVDIRRETRDLLRRVSQRLGLTYDETLRVALGIVEALLSCRAIFERGERFEVKGVGIVDTSTVKLVCGDLEVSMDPKEYRKLRKVLRVLPKPSRER